MADRERGLFRLERQARWAGFRLRLNRVLERATALALFFLVCAAALLAIAKVSRGSAALTHAVTSGLFIALGAFLLGVVHAALRHAAPLSGALALERHHGLRGRVTNALAFASTTARVRTPLMEAAIDDGAAVADQVSARRSVPLERPPGLLALIVLGGATLLLALLEVPKVRVIPSAPHHLDAVSIAPDDAELFRTVSENLVATAPDPEALAGARRFNQVVEDLAARRLDRTEVFRRLDELERSIKDPTGLDANALDQALDGIARELDKSALAKPVAQALAEKRLADAAQAMKDLAKKIAGAKKDTDKAKLDELRKSFQRASRTVHNKGASESSERKSLEERRSRLLKKKNSGAGLTPSEQQELDRTERRLERLDRQKAQSDAQSKQMSGLDRDLEKAAEDLMKDLGESSRDVEQGAQDINRANQQRMSDQQKRELERRIQELRQLLRQQGQAGRDRIRRMMAYGQRAHGNGSHGQGQGRGQGQGQSDGQGQGLSGGAGLGKGLVLKPGGLGAQAGVMLAPGGGRAGNQPGGPGGGGQHGEDWGTGHDPNVRGAATALKGKTKDVTAVAADTGQGTASSQVIYGAAERGFAAKAYKKVFTDYQTVAEESLAKDEIPPGYRFYVKRYFQLIRPRD